MKILFTSDLHIVRQYLSAQLDILRNKIKSEKPDVLAVSGDISEEPLIDSGEMLGNLDVPVVFCLGNHEFVRNEIGPQSVANTLNRYKHSNSEATCLDISGFKDIGDVRFVGNVLWYDGSLANLNDAGCLVNNIHPNWLDSHIEKFSAIKENLKCVKQIQESMASAEGKKVVLVTHCVPHRRLNWFDLYRPMSIYNAYSGVDNLFDKHDIYPDVALCGHTHHRMHYTHSGTSNKEIRCVNVGYDYFFNTGEIVFEVVEI